MKTANLQNEIEESDLAIKESLQIILTGDESYKQNNKWKSYQYRKVDLQKHRVKALSIIRGQCKNVLIDKMKSYPD